MENQSLSVGMTELIRQCGDPESPVFNDITVRLEMVETGAVDTKGKKVKKPVKFHVGFTFPAKLSALDPADARAKTFKTVRRLFYANEQLAKWRGANPEEWVVAGSLLDALQQGMQRSFEAKYGTGKISLTHTKRLKDAGELPYTFTELLTVKEKQDINTELKAQMAA